MRILCSILLFLLLTTTLCAKELVVLGADWCPSCVKLKKFLESNPKEIQYFTSVDIINIDNDPDLKQKLKIKLIPTSFIFNDQGKIESKKEGFSESSYREWLDKNKD